MKWIYLYNVVNEVGIVSLVSAALLIVVGYPLLFIYKDIVSKSSLLGHAFLMPVFGSYYTTMI